jgi:hypothetical protein
LAQTAFVRAVGDARKLASPVYGVIFRTIKPLTSIEVRQSPGLKFLQGS